LYLRERLGAKGEKEDKGDKEDKGELRIILASGS
jgi:hypothetical protein